MLIELQIRFRVHTLSKNETYVIAKIKKNFYQKMKMKLTKSNSGNLFLWQLLTVNGNLQQCNQCTSNSEGTYYEIRVVQNLALYNNYRCQNFFFITKIVTFENYILKYS